MRKLIDLLALLVMLIVLLGALILYLNEHYYFIGQWAAMESRVIEPFLKDMVNFSETYHLAGRWLIAGIFALVIIFQIIKQREKQTSFAYPLFAYFMIAMFLVFGVGGVITIYFWTEESISFFGIFTFHRGPREEFLEKVLHPSTLVVASVLMIHLLYKLGLCLRFFRLGKKKLSTLS